MRNQTMKFKNAPAIESAGTIVGVKEGEGPLASYFDQILGDSYFGEKSWEKAENAMQKAAVNFALGKASLLPEDIDVIFAGDLLNQCIATSFGIRDFNIPFFGLYGACSTMAETLMLGAMTIDGGYASRALCVTSSHFSTAERQYRMPMELGGCKAPTAQWTVTGSGAALLSKNGAPRVTCATIGKIVDFQIDDANNMGAAMAPAAADTLSAHLRETGRASDYYDLIVTGDLGAVGKEILLDLAGDGLCGNYNDCGVMIFDTSRQKEVAAGGSGCGCSAVTLCGYLLQLFRENAIKRLLFIGTGALMSPTSTQQGETIPSVAHAVAIEV